MCWKTSSVNALVDSDAFVHQAPALRGDSMCHPSLAGMHMWQLHLPTKRAAEKEVARIFINTKKIVFFFCFPKYNEILLSCSNYFKNQAVTMGFFRTILFSQLPAACTHMHTHTSTARGVFC